MLKALLPLLLLVFLPTSLFGQLHQWDGQNSGDNLGGALSGAGDVNGDGFDDVILGASGFDPSGSAYVYSGVNGALLYQLQNGQSSSDTFGESVSAAGDVNGDGFADVIVGASKSGNNGANSGSAYVYSGANGALLYEWDGESTYDRFGWSVSGAGDLNNDGFDDLIVGAYYSDNNGGPRGAAYAFSGANGSLLYQWDGENNSDFFGDSVSGVGDVNSDGFDDVIVGAEQSGNNGANSGSAYVYSGANGALLYQWDGESAYDHFGGSVSGAGDVNGDGIPDVVVGAQYTHNNNRGSAYAYSGADGTLLYEWVGEGVSIWFGSSVSGAGDVNGDGFDDAIVGARLNSVSDVHTGAAYVYSGVNGALIYSWAGQNAYDYLGCAVSGAGDVNGDGIDELLIGAYGSDNNGGSSGSAYVYEVFTFYSTTDLFAGDPIPAVFTIAGAAPNSSVTLGYSFSGAGPFTTVFGIVDMTPPINTLAVLSADANGDASWTVNVPPHAHGRTLYTQALNAGLLTNSLAIDIR